MVALTAKDADRSIDVHSGDEISVTLAENPTTGFRWAIASLTGELTLLSSDFDRSTDARPGAGGRRTIRLRAGRAGTGELRVRSGRSWETESTDVRELRFSFAIKSA
jgi:inhibitor of cysteine peptidase